MLILSVETVLDVKSAFGAAVVAAATTVAVHLFWVPLWPLLLFLSALLFLAAGGCNCVAVSSCLGFRVS